MPTRIVEKEYHDPLELIWTHCAAELGMRIERDDEVFASWDGNGTLRIGKESLDKDDSLAQMVLHEACHFIIEGPESFQKPDWGLNDADGKTRVHEFAALRLQAHFADQCGLRKFFMATTQFYEYYLALPDYPLVETISAQVAFQSLRKVTTEEDMHAIELASQANGRWMDSDWRIPIENALHATKSIHAIVARNAPDDSIWNFSSKS